MSSPRPEEGRLSESTQGPLPVPVPAPELALQTEIPTAENPAAVYLAQLAPGSRRTMREALDVIAGALSAGRASAASLPWHLLRFQHTAAVRAFLADRYAPATVNKQLAALRGTVRQAWRLGQMTAEDYHRAIDLEAVKGERLPAGRALSRGEELALFQGCALDATPAGARDGALLAVLLGAGIRRSEAAALQLADYDRGQGRLLIRSGKGRKERATFIADGADRWLSRWLKVRGEDPGPLFYPVDKAGQLQPRAMSPQAIMLVCQKRATRAGLAPFTPHDGRRSWIGNLLSAGADIATVSRLAGHSAVTVTARYDRRPEEEMQRASRLLALPYFE